MTKGISHMVCHWVQQEVVWERERKRYGGYLRLWCLPSQPLSHAPRSHLPGNGWTCTCWSEAVNFFLFFFFLLCFAKVGFVEGNHRWVHVTGGRETCRLGSARVYVLSIFPEVSILQTWPFPVSFLLALIFLEIVPKWESTVLGPDNNSTNL